MPTPAGFERIVLCYGGEFSAKLANIGFLAFRRSADSNDAFIQGDSMLDDIVTILVEDGEEVPEDYVALDFSGDKTSRDHSLRLAFRKLPAMGLCDLRFSSALLDRYPEQVRLTLSLHRE